MADWAIVRADGSVDKVSAPSLFDASDEFGWPGNGEIVPFDPAVHTNVRFTFANRAEEQWLINGIPMPEVATPPEPIDTGQKPEPAAEPDVVAAPYVAPSVEPEPPVVEGW